MTGTTDTVLLSAQRLLFEVFGTCRLRDEVSAWPRALASRVATNLMLGGYTIADGVPVLVLTPRDRNAAAVLERLLRDTVGHLGFGQLAVDHYVRDTLRHARADLTSAMAWYDNQEGANRRAQR